MKPTLTFGKADRGRGTVVDGGGVGRGGRGRARGEVLGLGLMFGLG